MKGSINGAPYEVPDGYSIIGADTLKQLRAAQTLLDDLSRSAHGRHKGDAESQDPTGVSQGNQLLPPGTHVGHDRAGRRLVVPENPSDAVAWTVAKT